MPKDLSDHEVSALLKSVPTGPCWSGRMYLGSMFVLDFGERLLMPRSRGSPVVCGASTLSVRNCYWEFFSDSQRIADANSASEEDFASAILPRLLGASLEATSADSYRVQMDIALSNRCRFALDLTGRWKTEDLLAEFTLQDGRYVQLPIAGKFVLSDDMELFRRQQWEVAKSTKRPNTAKNGVNSER